MAHPFVVVAGLNVLEDEGLALETAQELKRQLESMDEIEFYFKASFDKANRSSRESYRGPGMEEGLKILAQVKKNTGLKLLTDFHEPHQANPVAEVVDFLQIPAFLCRQTDLVVAGAKAALKQGCKVNVKKAQFLAPWDVPQILGKLRGAGLSDPQSTWICERGTSFGYNNLVVDMSAFQWVQSYGVPAMYDATHSVQTPGAADGGKATGGRRGLVETLARAAVAAGADGIFLECHPYPDQAKCDGPSAFYLEKVGTFIEQLLEIHRVVKKMPKLLPEASQ